MIAHMLRDGYGWAGPAFGGDSGSGVINAVTNEAEGNLTATAIISLPYAPGETIGSRMTWILSFLGSGYSLVNADRTTSRDTTNDCAGSAAAKGTEADVDDGAARRSGAGTRTGVPNSGLRRTLAFTAVIPARLKRPHGPPRHLRHHQ